MPNSPYRSYERSERSYSNQSRSGSRRDYDYDDDYRGRRMPERDDEGRFVSDDDRYASRGRSSYGDDDDYRSSRSHGRDYDHDRAYRSSGRRQYRERGEEGRFVSDDDRSRSSRYDREDYRPSRYRGSSRNQYRERDDEGRFMSDDDSRYGRSYRESRGGYRERDDEGRFMNDDHRSSRSHRGNPNQERDEDGRFVSREDEDQDDNVRSLRSHRGHASSGPRRGWHGDPKGHAEAGSHSHDNVSSSRSTRNAPARNGRKARASSSHSEKMD